LAVVIVLIGCVALCWIVGGVRRLFAMLEGWDL
jgi:hypothetical protein